MKDIGGVGMISFIICLALLIGGYFVYGKVVENTLHRMTERAPGGSDQWTVSIMW